jgi:phosphatidylglycerophosphatase C
LISTVARQFPKQDMTIVFDFDHTLTSWDSSDRFFRWLIKRNLWRIGLIAILAPVLGPLFINRKTRKIPVRYAVWVATLLRSHERIESLAYEHVARIVANGEVLLLREGASQLHQHIELGHSVVIATGSLEVLAKQYLHRSGLGHVQLVGSSLKPYLYGMASKEHCIGERKIPMLTQRGYPPPWAVTYTDHERDLPLISNSAECFLVNPRPKAIRAITAKLSFTPTVLSWR